MRFGVLEPRTSAHVPGTILLNDEQAAAPSGHDTQRLKHAAGKDGHIILAPQPSEDPNDPLNWSSFRKHFVLGVLCFGAIIHAAALGPLLAAGVVQIAMELQTTTTKVALLSGYYLLTTGATGPLVSAAARKWGKRPVYIFSSVMGVVGCIIGEVADNYEQLLAARIVQGFATSAYESIVVPSIGDLFFVHERGSRVAIIMFILAAISNGIAIIAGPITANLGWHYNFHILQPFVAAQLVLVVFFVPETTYRRSAVYNIDTAGSEEDLEKLAVMEGRAAHRETGNTDNGVVLERGPSSARASAAPPPPTKKTYWQTLSPYNGVFVDDSIFKMLLAVPVIMLNLGACYNVFVSGICIAWYVSISVLSSIMFTAPPYGYTAAGVGYTSVGPLIGGLLGSLFMAYASDKLVSWMTRKNDGVYEPEFRIPLMSIGLATTIAGLVGFGYAIRNQDSIYLVCFVWGLMLFGLTVAAIVTTGYALDAFREHSTEIFIMNMVFKNFFFYGLTNYIIEWYMTKGVTDVFNTMAGISAAVMLTSIPMYVYGKRYRHFWHHHNLIKIWHLETDKTGAEE